MRQLVNPLTFGRPCIGLIRHGCTNRPFYHITVFPNKALGRHWEGNKIEELGTFDPMPNERNEKLVALKIDRIKYWMGVKNAHVSPSVLELLGLAGLLPIHPKTIMRARIHRNHIAASPFGKREVTAEKDEQKEENVEKDELQKEENVQKDELQKEENI